MLMGLLCSGAVAQSTEADVSARLVGKQLFLRGLWGDDKLKFDADGKPAETYAVQPFTVDGFEAESVSLKGGNLKASGHRFGLEFDTTGAIKHVPLEKMTIEVNGDAGTDFGKALDAIFTNDLVDLVPAMPGYWQKYAAEHFLLADNALKAPSKVETKTSDDKLMHIGGSVEKPKPLHTPQPEYSKAARKKKLSGVVQVYLVIETDGTPSHITILKPLGMGLDDQAALCVSQYRFKPATKDGKPVRADIWIDLSFQIW